MAVPLVVGLVLVRLAWQPKPGIHAFLLQFTIAAGLALGISSCTFFLWLAGGCTVVGSQFPLAEAVGFLSSIAICLMFKGPRRAITSNLSFALTALSSPDAADSDKIRKALSMGFFLVITCAVAAMILVLINKPHGSGDAYAIWNLRARFLFRGHEQWTSGFSSLIAWSHPDYPLLLPSSIARFWTYIGLETPRTPQLIAAFFTLGTIVLLFSSVAVLRSVIHGLVCALFLVSNGLFIKLGASQYADIPIGFFILTTIVLLALKDTEEGGHSGLLCIAGVAAGFAAWTKNEGLLFLVAIFTARFATLLMTRGPRVAMRELAFLLIGVLPVLGVLVYFKLHYAPPNYLFGSEGFQPFMQKLSDPGRYVLIAKSFGNEILRWGNGLTPIFVLYLIVTGVNFHQRYSTTVFAGSATLILMAIGYFFVYVLTPCDLKWHLGTSLERLLMQLWPTFLFVVFMTVRPLARHRVPDTGSS